MMLELDGLSHRYDSEQAVDDVSFAIESGQLVGLLGPSGCGKTTLVQAIAGHLSPTAGRVHLRGTDVTDDPPESRNVGVVFQQSTLFPHLTVSENVAYGLTAAGIEADRRAELVAEYLALVDLQAQHESYPAALSGGQQRRVELARALAPQPDLLVLDEPLSALDRNLRQQLREEIARIQRETGVTTLFVTHDQEEAMALADRLVVMNSGEIAGVGRPRSLYSEPPSRFVASFLGRSNTVSATVLDTQPSQIEIGNEEIALADTVDWPAGSTVTCHIRPADLSLSMPDDASNPSLSGTVAQVTDLGRRYDVRVRLATGETLVVEQTAQPPVTGAAVAVGVSPAALTLFVDD